MVVWCQLSFYIFAKILDRNSYEAIDQRNLSMAEKQDRDSFHCQTINCGGWCIKEPQLTMYQCEVCYKVNCVKCKSIHYPMTCAEYQHNKVSNNQAHEATLKYEKVGFLIVKLM